MMTETSIRNNQLHVLRLPQYSQDYLIINSKKQETDEVFPKIWIVKIYRNPNPRPTGTRFGFLLFGAGAVRGSITKN